MSNLTSLFDKFRKKHSLSFFQKEKSMSLLFIESKGILHSKPKKWATIKEDTVQGLKLYHPKDTQLNEC